MAVFLRIAGGPKAGKKFPIATGTTIGRGAGDIRIDDAKMSVKHAFIESRDNGFYLVDAGSANGIKLGKDRVPEILLVHGIRVRLGRTLFEVIESEEPTDIRAPGAWIPVVQGLLRRALAKSGAPADPAAQPKVAAFEPPLLLKFIQGRQLGQEWTIGYGPREAGSGSPDLQIEEPDAPAICFELIPGRGGASFRTRHRTLVRLNGAEADFAPIGDGDIIDIENTRILVRAAKNAGRKNE